MRLRRIMADALGIISPEQWAKNATEQEILKLVRQKGIEDCAAIIRFVSPEKLRTVIDLDVWKNKSSPTGQRREVFEASQFLVWIETLLETGSDEAIEALKGMGLEFCAGALAHYIDATPMDVYAMRRAESGLAVEDKDVEHGRALELGVFGQAYVLLKTAKSSRTLRSICIDDLREVMNELLAAFEEHAPEFLEGIFFHISRLADDSVAIDDFEADRNLRLEQKGYTPAHKSYEYLLRFRKETGLSRIIPISSLHSRIWNPESWQNFADRWLVQDSMVITSNDVSILRSFMEWASEQGEVERSNLNRQWVFLANLLVSGWECNGQRFKPQAALNFLESVLSLGLELSVSRGIRKPSNLADLFEEGWHYLYQEVCLRAARHFEARLRLRHPRNQEFRETLFRFCSRHKIDNISVVSWISSGNYKHTHLLIDDLQFAMSKDCFTHLITLLDPSPRIKSDSVDTWIKSPGDEKNSLEKLKKLLGDLRDPFDQ